MTETGRAGIGDEVMTAHLLHTQPIPDPTGAPPGPTVPKQRRPKRKQVKRACVNCRKSHSGCDDLRPCSRCIDNGLESSCADIPRKKRATRRKLPNESGLEMGGDGSMMAVPGMVCQDRVCQDGGARGGKTREQELDEVARLIDLNSVARAGDGMMGHHHGAIDPHHLPPAVSSHPLRLKTEPSTADHGHAPINHHHHHHLHHHFPSSSSSSVSSSASAPSSSSSSSSSLSSSTSPTYASSGLQRAGQPKASDIASGMNKANNYQSLVTELSDLRRYNTRLEHTLQNILVEVQQLRSRSDGSSPVRVKTEPSDPATISTSASQPTVIGANVAGVGGSPNFHSFGNEVPGIATWRVHDSTLLECNDRFMEIVQQPLETLKNNFKCLQLFPQRLYDEFIGFKQSVLYGENSNPSKETYLMLPDGREKPVVMTLQALKHEENVSPQFMVMHVVDVPVQATTPPGGEAAEFMTAHVHRTSVGQVHLELSPETMEPYSSAPPGRSATVTSITELDPSALHTPSTTTTTTTTTPSSSSSSLSSSLPSLSSSSSSLAATTMQPQLQGQQQQHDHSSLLSSSPRST